MTGELEYEIAGEKVLLLPERALYWPREKSVIIADVHWGKAATFRKASIPVPSGTTLESLRRLDRVVSRLSVERLIIIGDLFHARMGRSLGLDDIVANWCGQHRQLRTVLVPGNHDRGAGAPSAKWCMNVVSEPLLDGPFAFRHYPKDTESHYTLAGHLHPAVRLQSKTRERLRLPCFSFGPNVGVLPAFGDFTGRANVEPAVGDRYFVIADDRVIAVK